MKKLSFILFLGLLACWTFYSPPLVQASCVVETTGSYAEGANLRDDKCDTAGNHKVSIGGTTSSGFGIANAAAPTFAEGATGYFSWDLAGNLRFTMGTLLEGEDQSNHLLMTSGGNMRITSLGAVTSATTSSVGTIFTGPVRFFGQITGSHSETKALTVDIYGNWTSSTTGGKAICQIMLPSTATVTHLEDTCPTITPEYAFYYYTVTVYTSAGADPFTLYAMQ